MILFLDDEQWRHDLVEKWHPGEVTHVFNCVQFFKAIHSPVTFTEIWLDHDLGQLNDKDPVQGDGMIASRMLVDLYMAFDHFPVPNKIKVHSFNKPAADRMVSFLTTHFYTQVTVGSCEIIQEPFASPILLEERSSTPTLFITGEEKK